MKKYILLGLLLAFFAYTAKSQTSVMTYNIRYDNPDDGENNWNHRKAMLVKQIKFYSPDVFGIQEGLHNQVQYLDTHLKAYTYVGVGRDDGNTKGEYSALFYKTSVFEKQKSGTFWLSETPSEPSVGWDAALERICTYALLENKKTNRKSWFFNTHFDHRGEKARKNSVSVIFNHIDSLNSGDEYPVVLTGDFNVEPNDKPTQLITRRLHDSKQLSQKPPFGNKGTYNGFNPDKPVKRRIDYIFVNEDISVKKYANISDYVDGNFLSDHLPVYAVLQFED